MNSVTVSIDHFGIAGDSLVKELQNQSSNKRARKVAFNALASLAKASKLIAKNQKILRVALTVNLAGELKLEFISCVDSLKVDPTRKHEALAVAATSGMPTSRQAD